MASWTTDTINERERFSYWREVVCQSLFNVSTETPPRSFAGRMQMRTSGSLRFLMSESSDYQFIRTEGNISSAPADHSTILMQLRGQTAITQDDDSFLVQSKDIAIFDGRQPFSASNSENGRRAVAVIPREMINSRVPVLRQRPLHRLASNSRFLDLARRQMMQLVTDDFNENETSLLAENLCNLLALASATDVALAHLRPELQITALLAFCRQYLHYPGLSPHFVAEHFGISVRTLHSRFAEYGKTFSSWVLENRLDGCRKALEGARQRTPNVSEIAYSFGFNDLSYFNKSFRARFGMSPSQWRHETVTKQ